ncbi:hypothetical protein POM88_044712 [Heracleum sosnowskyi]|uniref:Uncharacterized protein n=1 Tax=Heracleum sosnowskyi TaxID=360622 RepID=A0AAD8H5R5_9APIA|nr:hypothetical protein POM88_044712 [Heracleum sosnowskyi]
MFTSSGLDFVPNNYSAPLANENAPEAFHLIQDFLSNSDIGTALTAPLKLSASQIRTLWQTGTYDNGGESGSPSIIFEFQGEEFIVTPTTVRDALGLEDFNAFTISIGDFELVRMMREIGYSGPLTKIGQLKRPFLRKEWSFFFDCITRAFGKKCTNWDAIPTDSLQIGYSLLYGGNFDVARLVLTNIGEKMLENRNVVYFSRFCQLLFNFCCPDVEILEDDVILSFKLHKRIFSDLTNKDNKKGDVGVLLLPKSVQQFLVDSQQQPLANAEAGPSVSQSQRSKKSKLRAVKSARVKPSTTDAGVSNAADMPQEKRLKKRRANRAKSDDADEESEPDVETLHQRKRRLVAAHLFGAENVSLKVVEASEVAFQEDEAVNVDRVSMEFAAPDTANQEIMNKATVPTEDIANADAEDVMPAKENFFEDSALDFDFEAHPSISVCDTEDVAADQATLVIEDSVASHTENLSVHNLHSDQGEEVDQRIAIATEQIVEAVAENVQEAADKLISEDIILEALQQSVVEVVTKETELMQTANSEIPELVAEKVIDEAAQRNFETTAENVPAENTAENDNDDDTPAPSQEELSDIRVNSDDEREVNRATAEHFQDMYYKRWAAADCIFSAQRAADFLNDSVKQISNSDVLTSLKATVVQVKALNNRFDETQTAVTNLRNEVGIRDLTLKTDRSYYSAMFKQQAKDSDEIKKRLGKVEENQTEMSAQLNSISTALELLTSVLLSDDVKKGESVPNDKCKDTQSLRRRDDSADGGSKENERKQISAQGKGRSRLNSDRLTNSASGSRLKSLIISANPLTDEEIATKMFLEEHGNEVTVEDMEAEMLSLAEEHEKKLKDGTYKKKAVKVPRRKEKGIFIKEISQQSIQDSRKPIIANTDKGKGKLVEEEQLPKKIYSTSDIAQVESRLINKSTSDVAHVDIATKIVTTSDKAQVVQNQLKGFLRPVLSETVTLEPVDFSQTRTVHGKQSYDKSGLGSHREKRINNSPMEQTSLAEPGVGVTQENLDKLESVQLIHHKGLRKDFLLYFMADGRVYRIGENDIHLKMAEELEYVLYLLKVRNQRTQNAAEVLRVRMMRAKVLSGAKITSAYIPKYKDAHGKIVEMKRNSARLRTDLGVKVLEFNLDSDKPYFIRLGNEMRKNSIYSLRAAIYQTGESDPELRELKKVMIEELERAERRLLMDYLRTVPDIQEIK